MQKIMNIAVGIIMGMSITMSMIMTMIMPTHASASDAFSSDTLPAAIAQLLHDHQIPISAVSIVVREMNGNTPLLLRRNANTSRNPASAIKLLTTLAALELLGPGYQWQTNYLVDGVITNGVLRGDLIFKGGGDPFLTVEQLLGHILALRQSGIKTITGQLIIDNSKFITQRHDRGAFDGRPERLYNVAPDAALTNFSATQIMIEPVVIQSNDGVTSRQIRVRTEPPLAGLRVVSSIKARAGKCIHPNSGWSYRVVRIAENLTVRLRGTYRTACGSHMIARSILPNHEYTYRLFTALWRALGGNLDGGYRVSKTATNARLVLMRESEPLADIITGINKFSNNVMSRQLLLTVGSESADDLANQPATVAAGVGAVRRWLSANDIAMPALVLENGSGLSRKSRLSADGMWALLKHGWDSTNRPEFVSSLPLAAIDGTLRKRLQTSSLRGRARIKTGLIDGVRSMAGYLHANNNRHYGVVMMIDSNKVNFHNGNAIQDAVLRWVYER